MVGAGGQRVTHESSSQKLANMYSAEVVIKLHMDMPKILCGDVCDVWATVHSKFTHRHTSCGATHTHLQALTHQSLQHQNSV